MTTPRVRTGSSITAGGARGIAARARAAALVLLALLVPLVLGLPAVSHAQDACPFAIVGSTMLLLNDCVTSEPIDVPDGMTLDGDFHTIVAIDPPDGAFTGAVIRARGRWASVVNTVITTAGLRNVCHEAMDRLRGISFEGASGVIRGNTIDNIRKPGSACEEGTAIEARNVWAEESPAMVTIESNAIDRYQKSGIVLHGWVDATVRGNGIGASASQALLAANSIQVGPGARATVEENTIVGNSFPDSRAAGTAILLVGSGAGTIVASNVVLGNADVGIYVMADAATVTGNELIDEGPDGYWDIGIVNLGVGNVFVDNRVDGYRTRSSGVDGGAPAGGTQQIE